MLRNFVLCYSLLGYLCCYIVLRCITFRYVTLCRVTSLAAHSLLIQLCHTATLLNVTLALDSH
jgi:hypothetical protein